MKDNKKTKQVIAITILTSLILIMAVTTAYFAVSVSNTNNERVNTNSAHLSIVYTDCASSKQSDCANMTKNLAQDESFEKTFKVYNNGTMPVDYKIIFKELTNTFKKGDLVYTIKDLNDNVLQSERPIPYAPNQTTNVNAFLDTIEANTTKEFKIVVKLKETTEDQTENASATYSIKLGLSSQNGGTDNILNLVRDADASSTDIITKTAPSGSACTNTLAYDGTVDNNLRYIGVNPCNYVSFNNELWRIVGVMNNVDDGVGNLATRIKLVRKDSLGGYSWDSSSSTVNDGQGVNDWTQADLMQELNGDYLNTSLSENTLWYNGENDLKNGVFQISKGLKESAQSMISDATWYLGDYSYENFINDGTALFYYNKERDTNQYGKSRWVGKVALLYPSDFIFSTEGDNNNPRSKCITIPNSTWNNLHNGCFNTYLGNENKTWLLTNVGYNTYGVAFIFKDGYYLSATYCSRSKDGYNIDFSTLPSVYLNSDVTITGGDGSQENPYTLK